MASALALLGAIASGPRDAEAASGRLAQGFGDRGVYRLDGLFSVRPVTVATGPGGRVFVLGDSGCDRSCEPIEVARLKRDGSLDRRYGSGGIARLGRASDIGTDMVVDRRGRAVVVAKYRHPDGSRQAKIVRFGPGGGADRSFGDHGEVLLGRVGDLPELGIDRDRRGRIYGFATWSRFARSEATGRYETTAAISVTRLDAGGELDRGFGGDGEYRHAFRRIQRLNAVAERRRGGVVLYGDVCCPGAGPTALRITPHGRLDGRFGRWRARQVGGRRAGYATLGALARRNGTVDLYGAYQGGTGFVARVRPDGRTAVRFGSHRGTTFVAEPVRAAGVDRRGRMLAVATTDRGSGRLNAYRLTYQGHPDRAFGRYGQRSLEFLGGRHGNVSMAYSRGRPILFSQEPRSCPFRGPGECDPADPLLVALQGGPFGRSRRR